MIAPGLYAEPLGVDFSDAVAKGLRTRLAGQPPEAIARVTLLVNTTRMARRVAASLRADGPTLLPRIGLVSDLASLLPPGDVPGPDLSALALRLRLTPLVAGLLAAAPGTAPPAAAFDLAGSLATLLGEMQEEGVTPDALAQVDVGTLSAHWQDSLRFLNIVAPYAAEADLITPGGHQAACLAALLARWEAAPPSDPVIVAGSTGSRGGTVRLMRAVLGLPQGAVILPGLDADMPAAAFAALTETSPQAPGGAQDHPQFRHAALLTAQGMTNRDVPRWGDAGPASPARNALMSLALRPAPATDAWRDEGPDLADLDAACAGITLLEAPDPPTEAAAIALGLRGALADGRRAALITPDRVLARQVSAQLDRWGIEADDSAGRPLSQSAPGRLLLLLAEAKGRPITAEGLTVLLNHPLTHSDAPEARRAHLARSRRLETRLLRRAPLPFPDRAAVTAWAAEHDAVDGWTAWLGETLTLLARQPDRAPLDEHVAAHLDLAEQLAGGARPDEYADGVARPTGALWDGDAGREALRVMRDLAGAALAEAAADPVEISAAEYARLLRELLSAEEVRDPYSPHPDVMIWGALEARVRTADLVILGGLTDGTWPDQPTPDPWMNRSMRTQAGLRLPERVIGLSAHDFQQAAAGPEVWLSRPVRDAEAETVPSRWLNRLTGLLGGLGPRGEAALSDMRARGRRWLDWAAALDVPQPRHAAPPAPRPAPAPPPSARPRSLSVTQVETLIRDPYAIYAAKVLGLRQMDPLRQTPDARLRGTIVHAGLERFVRALPDTDELPSDAPDRLRAAIDAALAADAPWHGQRRLWLGKFDRVADAFLARERERRAAGRPVALEGDAIAWQLPGTDVTLVARADRIDLRADGTVALYDYKTGEPPSRKQQAAFAKQLQFEALMIRDGAVPSLGRARIGTAHYVKVGSGYKEVEASVGADALAETETRLRDLLRAYDDAALGYVARLAPEHIGFASPFDQLARRGEWDDTAPARRIPVGGAA